MKRFGNVAEDNGAVGVHNNQLSGMPQHKQWGTGSIQYISNRAYMYALMFVCVLAVSKNTEQRLVNVVFDTLMSVIDNNHY